MKLNQKKKIYYLGITVFLLLLFSTIAILGYIYKAEYLKDSPYDVLVSDIQANTVVISWKTVNDTPTYIKLGESYELLGSGELTKFHKVRVVELEQQSKYTFTISDGKREWNEDIVGSSNSITPFVKQIYEFNTVNINEDITLPNVKELHVLPNELIYVSLFNTKTNTYSEVKSYYANKYGGVAVDVKSFQGDWNSEDIEVRNINYFTSPNIKASTTKIYASEVNCNQNIPEQTINGITKQEYSDLATRWVAGRGKHYALECFNDVVYQSKMVGVDPAFALAVWLNESGASNYTQDINAYGYVEDWGIHTYDVPVQDFNAQLKHFLQRGHYNICPGLTQWEAWGNIYRWGRCNTDSPVAQQEGIDYYKKIESLYHWITNGRKLPKKVTGLTIPINESQQWSENQNSLCCTLEFSDDIFIGTVKNNLGQSTCENILEDSTVDEVVQISSENECEQEYEGVCCYFPIDIKWYPKKYCNNIVIDINNSIACEEYAKDSSCFFRNGRYEWLPKEIGDDSIQGVTSQVQCESRNSITTYTLSLKQGVNIVGFDFSPSFNISPLYASTLLEQNPSILLIGNFQGYEWKDLVKQSEKIPFVGQDFYFEQNRGYLIISNEDITLTLDGWRNPEVQYQELDEGWNLVGGSIYSNPSSASILISNLLESNIDVDIVGVWEYEKGSFVFRREDQDGQVYGIDIKLEDNQGIFIKK